MAKLKLNKTQMCKLAKEYLLQVPAMLVLPPSRYCAFTKLYRSNDYRLRFTSGGYYVEVIVSIIYGRPYIRINVYEDIFFVNPQLSKFFYLDRDLLISCGILRGVA